MPTHSFRARICISSFLNEKTGCLVIAPADPCVLRRFLDMLQTFSDGPAFEAMTIAEKNGIVDALQLCGTYVTLTVVNRRRVCTSIETVGPYHQQVLSRARVADHAAAFRASGS